MRPLAVGKSVGRSLSCVSVLIQVFGLVFLTLLLQPLKYVICLHFFFFF